ncbi:hypothetical protein LSTR_LSTR011729 [Laodelphax striatellus]|uniref:Uncharacterized protein n=1 Tax=Laodelphax striatellus TaxID=195883 RepID=A0A482WLR5_LAOST|nr:hypothetical protein LSTR_LSTR011729 [Laodelphax striatellus]
MNFNSDSILTGDESCFCKTRMGLISGITSPFEACFDNIIEFISLLFSCKFYHAIPSMIIIVIVWLLFNHKARKPIYIMANGNNKIQIALKILIATPIIQVSLFSWLRSQEFLYCILSRLTSTSIFSGTDKQKEHKFYLNSLFFNRRSTESKPFTELLCCSTAICIASYILFLTVNGLKSRNKPRCLLRRGSNNADDEITTIRNETLSRTEPNDDDGIVTILDRNEKRIISNPSKTNKNQKDSHDDGNENFNERARILTRARTRSNPLLPDVILIQNDQ